MVFGVIDFADKIKEWKKTKKRFLWNFLWGLAFSTALIVYTITYLISSSLLAEHNYSAAVQIAVVVAIIYMTFGVGFPYGFVKAPLKKIYTILEQMDEEKLKKQQANCPDFRAKILGKTQSNEVHSNEQSMNEGGSTAVTKDKDE